MIALTLLNDAKDCWMINLQLNSENNPALALDDPHHKLWKKRQNERYTETYESSSTLTSALTNRRVNLIDKTRSIW